MQLQSCTSIDYLWAVARVLLDASFCVGQRELC